MFSHLDGEELFDLASHKDIHGKNALHLLIIPKPIQEDDDLQITTTTTTNSNGTSIIHHSIESSDDIAARSNHNNHNNHNNHTSSKRSNSKKINHNNKQQQQQQQHNTTNLNDIILINKNTLLTTLQDNERKTKLNNIFKSLYQKSPQSFFLLNETDHLGHTPLHSCILNQDHVFLDYILNHINSFFSFPSSVSSASTDSELLKKKGKKEKKVFWF